VAFAHGTNPWASQIRCAVSTMSSKELGNGRFILSKGTITRTTLVSPRLYPSAVIAITQEKKIWELIPPWLGPINRPLHDGPNPTACRGRLSWECMSRLWPNRMHLIQTSQKRVHSG